MGYTDTSIRNIVLAEPTRTNSIKSQCYKKTHAKGTRV